MRAHPGCGQLRDLFARAGARRIEHDRVEAIELGGGQRPAEQVAVLGEHRAPAPAGRRLQREQDRVARAFAGIDLARQRQARRCPARRTGRRRWPRPPIASRTAATSAASPSAVACRKPPVRKRHRDAAERDRHGLRLPARLRPEARRRCDSRASPWRSANAVIASAAASPSAGDAIDQQVDTLVGQRQVDVGATAAAQIAREQRAQRRDQREQLRAQAPSIRACRRCGGCLPR